MTLVQAVNARRALKLSPRSTIDKLAALVKASIVTEREARQIIFLVEPSDG